jgi:hypothetical protein
MTPVHFAIHRFTTDVEELDEQALARLLASDPSFVASLCEQESLEGALVIGDTSIVDDLSSAIQRLCYEAVERLVVPGTTYAYPYFTSNAHASLTSSADGGTISLSGDDDPGPCVREIGTSPCALRLRSPLPRLSRRPRRGARARGPSPISPICGCSVS